ncbi:MAG: hypothetical protein Kow0025_22220 [Thermodesulfovibrionales bacterium]
MSGEEDRAFRYACLLLGYRGRSEVELAERLRKKGFGPAAVSGAMERLRRHGYIDDSALAMTLRRTAEDVKLLGSSGARQYLMKMGIPRETAEDALSGYDEVESAARLLRRKSPSLRGLTDEAARRRLYGMLRRRGYGSATIRKTLESIKETET